MNIKAVSTSRPGVENVPSGYVENPAVLADTLWKNAPSQVTSSVSLINTVPITMRQPLTVSTTLACMESLCHLSRFTHISRMTRKPMPPKKIRAQVVRFRSTLWR